MQRSAGDVKGLGLWLGSFAQAIKGVHTASNAHVQSFGHFLKTGIFFRSSIALARCESQARDMDPVLSIGKRGDFLSPDGPRASKLHDRGHGQIVWRFVVGHDPGAAGLFGRFAQKVLDRPYRGLVE